MKKIKYLLIMFVVFSVFTVVKAESIQVSNIIAEFQKKEGYEVTSRADGSSFTVNTGSQITEYSYSASDNTLSYTISADMGVNQVVNNDDVLLFVVSLSSNFNEYKNVKSSHPEITEVSYGSGCDLANMGFCYDSTTGRMQVVMSNQFTTYLYNYYANGGTSQNVPGDASKNSNDPLNEETDTNSQNPDTGTFTEIGIIVALLALLLVVINLKKHSETEFKI